MKNTQLSSLSKFLIIASCAVSFAVLQAGEVAYTGTLTGIDCDECKKTIARSLAKIEGVKKIRIEKNKDGTHKLIVTTDGTQPIASDAAAEAIKHAEHYTIKGWDVAAAAQ